MVKAALLSFSQEFAASNPPRFEVEIVDTLCNASSGLTSNCTVVANSTSLLNGVFQGGRPGCAHLLTPRVAVGGISDRSRAEAAVALAHAHGLPTVGFRSWEDDHIFLSSAPPVSLRVVPDSTHAARSILQIIRRVHRPQVVLWYCDTPWGHAVVRAAEAEAQQLKLSLHLAALSPSSATGVPPQAASAVGRAWGKHVETALAFANASHVLAMSEQCPLHDFVSFLSLHGAVRNRTWYAPYAPQTFAAGFGLMEQVYHNAGSPYALAEPFREFFLISSHDADDSADVSQLWAASLAQGAGLVEPWLQEYSSLDGSLGVWGPEGKPLFEPWQLPPEAEDPPPPPRPPERFLFDALYAAQHAVMSATQKHGPTFSNGQLLDDLHAVDFQGMSGHVVLDSANGARLAQLFIERSVAGGGVVGDASCNA